MPPLIHEPLCVLSPHLDDVALSCSHFLATRTGATTVVTVLAGAPDGPPGHWNGRSTGMPTAREAIAVRRAEDAAAMRVLGATPRWLDLPDRQYVGLQDSATVEAAIRAALDDADARTVLAPLGVHHPDHRAVADAALSLARAGAIDDLSLYLDLPYARTMADEVAPRLAEIRVHSDLEALAPVAATSDVKQRAVACYVSQIEPVRADHPALDDALRDPERYWRVVR